MLAGERPVRPSAAEECDQDGGRFLRGRGRLQPGHRTVRGDPGIRQAGAGGWLTQSCREVQVAAWPLSPAYIHPPCQRFLGGPRELGGCLFGDTWGSWMIIRGSYDEIWFGTKMAISEHFNRYFVSFISALIPRPASTFVTARLDIMGPLCR